MEAMISKMLRRFEEGALSRRELVQGLAMLTAAGAAPARAASDAVGLNGVHVNHVSIQVTDLARSVAFYENLFGWKVVSEDKPNMIARLGVTKGNVSLHQKKPTGLVDHFAIGVENFNKEAVTQKLQAHGITPDEDFDAGFHVKDPEGMKIQLVGA